jgi:hypothetical protein
MAPHIPGSAKNLQAQILSLFGRLLGRCVLRLDPRDCHMADVVGSRKDDIDRIFADIDAADNQLFVIFAIALPTAVTLLTIPLWS